MAKQQIKRCGRSMYMSTSWRLLEQQTKSKGPFIDALSNCDPAFPCNSDIALKLNSEPIKQEKIYTYSSINCREHHCMSGPICGRGKAVYVKIRSHRFAIGSSKASSRYSCQMNRNEYIAISIPWGWWVVRRYRHFDRAQSPEISPMQIWG